jgi:quercetin dioxygenase-like cupin family protein
MLNENEVAQDWASRGFGCDLWTDPPGQCWEDYVHPMDELVMVVDGTLEFEIGGQTLHPKPGEEIFIPAKVSHSVRNIGRTTAHWLYGYRQQT